jgi:hypothetical protein
MISGSKAYAQSCQRNLILNDIDPVKALFYTKFKYNFIDFLKMAHTTNLYIA